MSPRIDRSRRTRAGLTLVELLMATSIMSILAGSMAMLAISVEQGGNYSYSRSTAVQHARVVLDRITRMVNTATAAGANPGVVVVYDQVGTALFPDTLIVWQPGGTPANASGPPLVKEVIFYCPDPNNPNQLVEITAPTDTRTIPLDSATLNTASWRSTILSIKTAATSQKTLLTDLLRTASVNGSTPAIRGAVRFSYDLNPTASEWSSYQAGSLTWANIAWPLGLYSQSSGLRHVAVRCELQLMPAQLAGQQDTSGQLPMVFFGAASLTYPVTP